MHFKHGCFISYRRGKHDLMIRIVNELVSTLSSELEPFFPGSPVFVDKNDLEPGSYLEEEIAHAICHSVCLIVVYVPTYLDKDHSYCAREFCAMKNLEQLRYQSATPETERLKSLIIPIIFRGKQDIPRELTGNRLYVDFEDFSTATDPMKSNERYLNEITKVANYIYSRFKYFNTTYNTNLKDCSEFQIPKTDSDEVQRLLRDSTPPFPNRM